MRPWWSTLLCSARYGPSVPHLELEMTESITGKRFQIGENFHGHFFVLVISRISWHVYEAEWTEAI